MAGSMWLLDRMLRRVVRKGELAVIDHKGRSYRYGAPAAGLEPVTMRFADAGVPGSIVRNPRLAVAEAYMDGRLTFDRGDFLALILLVTANGRFEEGTPEGAVYHHRFRRLKAAIKRRNDERRARRNVAHHYDIGNDLYRLFLDADMQYSCAYFTDPANSLEQAQEDKKAHIAAKLALKPGQRVLDIGCGWGGLALYLHRHFGVEVLGVTLSEEQLKIARGRAAAEGVGGKVRFELQDYRRLDAKFDRIVSIGMFEHVGAEHYDEFFGKIRALLKPDGAMLLHTIGRFDKPVSGDPFAEKYIFPGYHLPNLSQIVQASERHRLISTDVEALRLHYNLTLRHWMARTFANRDAIVALYDERFLRMWEVYLAGAIAMFELGGGCVYQLQYVRDRSAVPQTRDYMFETERMLAAGDTRLAAE